MKYNCVILVNGHSEAPSKIKKTKLKQTTITATPGVCNYGSERHFVHLMKLFEGTDLDIDEEDVRGSYQAIKKTMSLDRTTPEKDERATLFLEDPLFMSEKGINKYREKEYHFFEKEETVGYVKVIVKGYPLVDIRDKLIELKGSKKIFKSDIFEFLEGVGVKKVLYLDMSCNGTEDKKLIARIRKTKVIGGKRIKTKRRKRL
jgi:hypothetical protein